MFVQRVRLSLLTSWRSAGCSRAPILEARGARPRSITDDAGGKRVRGVLRTADGRYVVRTPVASPLSNVGNTRGVAVRSLLRMEQRFLKQVEFFKLYLEFMANYELLGHMTRLPVDVPRIKGMCYLPPRSHAEIEHRNETKGGLQQLLDHLFWRFPQSPLTRRISCSH